MNETSPLETAIANLIHLLRNPDVAEPPGSFPHDSAMAAQPGLYAWWADDVGVALLSGALGATLPHLIYVGQAGATTWPSGKRGQATLRSRLIGNHIGGNVRASTFRHTLASALRRPLALNVVGPRRLDSMSEVRLTIWIQEHLRVAIQPYPDRDVLEDVEAAVLRVIDPPLNLKGMPLSPVRTRLQTLRAELAGPSWRALSNHVPDS